MKRDERFIISDNSGPPQLSNLDKLLTQVVDTLEKGRSDIFDIAEDCRNRCAHLQVELEELRLETEQVIKEVDTCEKEERYARINLMKVNKNFQSYSEAQIKEAYDTAQDKQVKLFGLRKQEGYLRRRRDELTREIKQLEIIETRADRFLNSSAMALNILQGNVEKINDIIEEAYRKQQIEMWIIASQEAERRKIARELHDGPAQSLASLLIRLDLVQYLWPDNADQVEKELDSIKGMGRESLADIRRIMFDLKPTIVHEEGLSATLQEYFNDYEAKYNFSIEFIVLSKKKKYDLSLEIALFRLVQEAITNIRKHAGVNRATIKIEDISGFLTLVIKDEGQGFDVLSVRDKKESYGILGMKERVQLFGGEMEIISSPGAGTQVIIKVPVEGEANSGQSEGNHSG